MRLVDHHAERQPVHLGAGDEGCQSAYLVITVGVRPMQLAASASSVCCTRLTKGTNHSHKVGRAALTSSSTREYVGLARAGRRTQQAGRRRVAQ